MSKKEVTRRDFILRFTALGALGVGVAACGGGETTPAAAPQASAQAGACSDLSMQTDAEKAMRTQLQYVAETADPAKNCANCALYILPEGNAPCGGCQLIKGPIAPNGYCVSWAPKPA